MWGGRAHVRTLLSMGPLVATRDNPRMQAFVAPPARATHGQTGRHHVGLGAASAQSASFNNPAERTAHRAGSVLMRGSVSVGRRSPGAFGFRFADHEGIV